MATAKPPCPLLKKHSQTDLLSRLKTRKILGVGGEDDDGEIHRSKISQVLGNEQKFPVRHPFGLRECQAVSAIVFTSMGIMALGFPEPLSAMMFGDGDLESPLVMRMYGGTLISLSLSCWNALYTADRSIIRWSLLTQICYFTLQILVMGLGLWEHGFPSLEAFVVLLVCFICLCISVLYYCKIGRKWKK
uniref:tumor protein p53-inducible protein 11 n=1 Tax=Myxine glutinosa TaxID=7769 RepID=UPI00358F53DC